MLVLTESKKISRINNVISNMLLSASHDGEKTNTNHSYLIFQIAEQIDRVIGWPNTSQHSVFVHGVCISVNHSLVATALLYQLPTCNNVILYVTLLRRGCKKCVAFKLLYKSCDTEQFTPSHTNSAHSTCTYIVP